jgi:hypothetical protein
MYEEAAKNLRLDNEPGILAKVDATLNEGLADRLGIENYPTFLFYA